ncbi:MAG: prepilin-type N-terminal cleavage/methylation domain-containing protein [Acidimicrobiaceae bacterium]|nr:prepilin-type N-terminal cleavage/methylation domain-containing protein [Acidimicrobiaceae bacterium]
MTPRERTVSADTSQGEASDSPLASEGFTLIELLIVIVVLGVLAAIVIFALAGVQTKAAVSACKTDAKTVETAVQAYETQKGVSPTASSDLTSGPNNYLQSWPSSPYYSITLSGSSVMVAAPSGTTALSATSPDVCIGAGSATTSSTTSSSTSTTSSTSSTTSTTSPSNGVTFVASTNMSNGSGTYGGTDILQVNNPSAITAMTVTVNVVRTDSATNFTSDWNSFPGGYVAGVTNVGATTITYTYTLASHRTIPANYLNGQIGSQYSGDSLVHLTTSDTWTVTSTSRGITATLSGHF